MCVCVCIYIYKISKDISHLLHVLSFKDISLKESWKKYKCSLLVFWMIANKVWLFWIIQKAMDIFQLTNRLMICPFLWYLYNLGHSSLYHFSKILEWIVLLVFRKERTHIFTSCEGKIVVSSDSFLQSSVLLQACLLEEPDMWFPLWKANVIWSLCFRVIWKLNTFLRNCFCSDCQFSAWEVYDQIIFGRDFYLGFFLLLRFEDIC